MSLVSPKLDKIPQECFKKDFNARPRLSSIQRASSVSKLGRLVSHGVVRVELVEFTRLMQVYVWPCGGKAPLGVTGGCPSSHLPETT